MLSYHECRACQTSMSKGFSCHLPIHQEAQIDAFRREAQAEQQ